MSDLHWSRWSAQDCKDAYDECRQLRVVNKDLLEALQATLKHIDDDMNDRPVVLWKLRETVCAAIAKATGTPS